MSTTSAPVSFQHRAPGPALAGLVGLFWHWEGHELPFSRERVLPEGTMELVIRLDSQRASNSGISGPRSRSMFIERATSDRLLGIHFKPGGAFPFLGFPLGELHNSGITLTDLWGERRGSELAGRLHEAQTVPEKFQVLEWWLLRVADGSLSHHPAVRFALDEFHRHPGLLSSAEAARRVNLSQRRFIELFREEVGMTPKLFCRVQRFRQVVTTLGSPGAVDWADIALSCGYFDQSHFIHDFQEFSGLTPTRYLRLRKPDSPLHVLVP